MNVLNLRNGNELSSKVDVADSMVRRMKGLLGKQNLGKGESLWIKPCNAIQTFGMRFVIDAVFLDRKLEVVSVRRSLRPNRISGPFIRAASVLELPEGTLAATDTRIGDRIEIA